MTVRQPLSRSSSDALYVPLASGKRREEVQDWATLLQAIYAKHNPSKVDDIPTILEQFKGRERFMLARLKEKYGIADDDDNGAIGAMQPPPEKAVDLQRRPGTAAQMFLHSLPTRGGSELEQEQDNFQGVPSQFLTAYPDMLPRLCMNRFYAAEGVKQASHRAWREIMGSKGGIALLSTHVGITASYYSEMTRSNSHMVAEAALHAMKELALRVPRASVLKVLPLLLETLHACVLEESWPVRDAAVGALGSVISTYSFEITQLEEADSSGSSDSGRDKDKDGIVTVFLDVCRKQLVSAIGSVRETAAVALADICGMKGEAGVRQAAREATCAHLAEHLITCSDGSTSAGKRGKNISTSAPLSFLPPAMLSLPVAGVAPPQPPGTGSKKGSSQWRRGGGWGCCLDCMEIRQGSVQDAEDGCTTLLSELPSRGKAFQAPEELIKVIAIRHPQYLTLFEKKDDKERNLV